MTRVRKQTLNEQKLAEIETLNSNKQKKIRRSNKYSSETPQAKQLWRQHES
jgi:hypothetical protein